ncbi:MAG: DUF4214 domain-containing protein [Rhizobiaceae bacterium]|nr:DUF4214 domain-containing protein [Rhizobiaceae bacterium]
MAEIIGTVLNEYLEGTEDADRIVSFGATQNGSTTLDGKGGDDTLVLEDVVIVGLHGVFGGSGNDTVDLSRLNAGGLLDLAIVNDTQPFAGGFIVLNSVENVIGTDFDDSLFGDGSSNKMEGGDGDDTIDGRGGTDIASYAGAAAGVTVSLAIEGVAQDTGGAGTDTLTSIERLIGSDHDDMLTAGDDAAHLMGGSGDDTLNGGSGNDDLYGGSGNDVIYTGGNPNGGGEGQYDFVEGGAGDDTFHSEGGRERFYGNSANGSGEGEIDTVTFEGIEEAVTASLLVGGGQEVRLGHLVELVSIENLVGTDFNDVLTGDDRANRLSGGEGNDQLDGGSGDDVLYTGGSSGGEGDTAIGGAGDDLIYAHSGVEFLSGGGGEENPADGSDTVDFSEVAVAASTPGVTVSLAISGPQEVRSGHTVSLNSIENLAGSIGNDVLTGDDGMNTLSGGEGDDTLAGGGGEDTLYGGIRYDTAVFDGDRADFTVVKGEQSYRVTEIADTTNADTLHQIERLQFDDGKLLLEPLGENLSFAYRIYAAAYGRTPDEAGLRFWTDVLDQRGEGPPEVDDKEFVASFFLTADEFVSKYGADPTNEEYINKLYQNVLHRDADQDGYDFWLGKIESGEGKDDMLIYFTDSGENLQNTAPDLDNGIWVL